MSKRGAFKDLLRTLADAGLLEFGSVIPRDVVHQALGIAMPAIGTRAQFEELALMELAAIDYCRSHLLDVGKYLAGTGTGYRVLLPSENQKQIELYMSSADKKLGRALKLSKNSPATAALNHNQVEARIHMKRQHTRHRAGAELRT
jgi:hypothetical protein